MNNKRNLRSVVCASVCEVDLSDPNNPVPIDGQAVPEIRNIVPETNRVIVNGAPGSDHTINIKLNLAVG